MSVLASVAAARASRGSSRVLAVVNDSFVAGAQFSFRVVGVIALVGLVVAILGVRTDEAGDG